jgi:hypothetical protein
MRSTWSRWSAIIGGLALAAGACMHEPTATEGPTSTTTGSQGGATGTGGSTGGNTATGTPAGSPTGTPAGTPTGTPTGTGGGGTVPTQLVDTGLLVRYFIDERADGQGNAELLDSAPDPLNLQMTWGTELNYLENADGNRGLHWTEVGLDSGSSVAAAGTKISQGLHGSTTGTIETVVEVAEVSTSSSRISHIGYDSESGSFTLSASSTTRLNFYKRTPGTGSDTLRGLWEVDFVTLGRVVIHLVYDSDQAAPEDRSKLYLDGALQPRLGGSDVPQGELIDIGTTEHYVLGNRYIGGRSFIGTLYYSALYGEPLTQAEVSQNVGVLLVDDDAPQ